MTFQEPRDVRVERLRDEVGWWVLVWVDGNVRGQLGPFAHRDDPADFMLWLIGAYGRLEVVDSERPPAVVFEDVKKERDELVRLNQRRASQPDLADLVRQFEEDPGSFRR